MSGVSEGARALPSAALRPYVRPYEGYRLTGFEPGRHIGMPSPFLTVILTIDNDIEMLDASGASEHFGALASGISAQPVTIAHDGTQHGIQLSLTPFGARALLGLPTSALGSSMVHLADVLGADGREIVDRISRTDLWPERFAIVDQVLTRRLLTSPAPCNENLREAWSLLTTCPEVRVAEVADDIGWSRKYLAKKFLGEFGVTPKEAAKIARFHRSHQLLRLPEHTQLADVATACGYFDQAHMARDWRELAGTSPSRWRDEEVFTFVQANVASESAQLSA